MLILPMLGKSSRFQSAGFKQPKYMLPIGNKTVFECVIDSFTHVLNNETIVLAIPNNEVVEAFVVNQIKKYKNINFEVIFIDFDTQGQADTIYQTIEALRMRNYCLQSDIYLFNIDTFRFNLQLSKFTDHGMLDFETFEGKGNSWSFALPDNNGQYVTKVVEKVRISQYCSTGCYHFPNAELFSSAYEKYYLETTKFPEAEHFIAPLYNILINDNYKIRMSVINQTDIICCGTPEEYSQIVADEYLVRLLNDR